MVRWRRAALATLLTLLNSAVAPLAVGQAPPANPASMSPEDQAPVADATPPFPPTIQIDAFGGDPLPERIDRLLPELNLTPAQISIYVQAVDQPTPRLAVNADWSRTPASVMKLVTSIVALDVLGPNHRWPTVLYHTGEIQDGTLHGDLIIAGFGDPYLTTDAYAGLIRGLRARGIGSIAGDLIFDRSQLAAPQQGRGDFDGAGQSPYNALPTALDLNRQVTEVVIYHDRPSGRVGAYTEPPLSGVDLINEATVVQAPCQGRHHRLQVTLTEPADARPQLRVSGSFASECPEERVPRLLLSPEQHAASAFHALWRQLGGDISGRVRLGDRPADAVLLTSVESRPLGELVRDVNKYSNNLSARLVFLALGVATNGPPGTTDAARAAVADWLEGHDLAFPELYIDNGSGLSRDSRIAARSLGSLLVFAYHQPWMPELIAALPIVGIDGTMARRMRHEPIVGRAHIKTGTLRDASCVAGYVLDRHGQRWAVVVMVNAEPGRTLPAWTGHAIHHEVLRWVHDGAP